MCVCVCVYLPHVLPSFILRRCFSVSVPNKSGSSCFCGSEAPRPEGEGAWRDLSIRGLCLAATRCYAVVSGPRRVIAGWSLWVARPKHMVSSCYKCPVLQTCLYPGSIEPSHLYFLSPPCLESDVLNLEAGTLKKIQGYLTAN